MAVREKRFRCQDFRSLADDSLNAIEHYSAVISRLHSKEHDWPSVLLGLPDNLQAEQGFSRFMGPQQKQKTAHQNQKAENQEYLRAVHVRNGSRLTAFTASTQGESGPIPSEAWWHWLGIHAAQEDEPYSYGPVEPVGLLRSPDAPRTVLMARPQLRVVNGWRSWRRATVGYFKAIREVLISWWA
jgi:hypothetical protein